MSIVSNITQLRKTGLDVIRRAGGRFLPDLLPRLERGDRKEASSLLERGRKQYNRKNFEKAEEYFQEALLADEAYVRAHYFLGLARYKLDDAQGALRAWKRAAKLDPSDPFAAKADSKIRYVQGHLNRAVNELESRLRKW